MTEQEDKENVLKAYSHLLTLKAYNILLNTMLSNESEIKPEHWIGASIAIMADMYISNGSSMDDCKKELISCLERYYNRR